MNPTPNGLVGARDCRIRMGRANPSPAFTLAVDGGAAPEDSGGEKRMIELHFGALAPPLSEQLAGVGLSTSSLKSYDADASAIVRLHIRSVLVDSEVRKARKRLLARIEREWKATQREKSDE